MMIGVLAGVTWALETVVVGIALGTAPLNISARVVFLAPFIATFLHDMLSAVYMFIYNALCGRLGGLVRVFKSPSFKWLALASAVGGPIGMTGYVMAVKYMGASVGAIASAVYPAIGTALACLFLKERVRWYRWIFLALTLLGVFGLGYSPTLQLESFWLGLLGAFMCAFGWGIEAVILAKCLKGDAVNGEYALNVRQAVSALVYGLVLLPLLGGILPMGEVLSHSSFGGLIAALVTAALFATLSYLLYYKAIGRLGAAKAMALNVTYTAWAIVFTLIILKDRSVLNPLSLVCAAVIVVCGILAATDFRSLFSKKR